MSTGCRGIEESRRLNAGCETLEAVKAHPRHSRERPCCVLPLADLVRALKSSEEQRDAMRLDLKAARHQLNQQAYEAPTLPVALDKAVECVAHLAEVMEGVSEADGMVRRARMLAYTLKESYANDLSCFTREKRMHRCDPLCCLALTAWKDVAYRDMLARSLLCPKCRTMLPASARRPP